MSSGPTIGRRMLVAGAAFSFAACPSRVFAWQQRAPTPRQTAGPFYPRAVPDDTDTDLVQVRGVEARASGTVAHIGGRILDRDGRPVAGAAVEIWQCDAFGRYLHPASGGRRARDRAFQGFGRAATGPDGSYAFRTIKPVAYEGRAPHIHFAVAAGGRRMTTQMYVGGDPLNERDELYRSLGRARDAVTVRLADANGIEAGALRGEFDIVL